MSETACVSCKHQFYSESPCARTFDILLRSWSQNPQVWSTRTFWARVLLAVVPIGRVPAGEMAASMLSWQRPHMLPHTQRAVLKTLPLHGPLVVEKTSGNSNNTLGHLNSYQCMVPCFKHGYTIIYLKHGVFPEKSQTVHAPAVFHGEDPRSPKPLN